MQEEKRERGEGIVKNNIKNLKRKSIYIYRERETLFGTFGAVDFFAFDVIFGVSYPKIEMEKKKKKKEHNRQPRTIRRQSNPTCLEILCSDLIISARKSIHSSTRDRREQ